MHCSETRINFIIYIDFKTLHASTVSTCISPKTSPALS